MTVAARAMALGTALLSMLVASVDIAAAGEDCTAAGEERAMSRLERTIAWMVSEETDYCMGVTTYGQDLAVEAHLISVACSSNSRYTTGS